MSLSMLVHIWMVHSFVGSNTLVVLLAILQNGTMYQWMVHSLHWMLCCYGTNSNLKIQSRGGGAAMFPAQHSPPQRSKEIRWFSDSGSWWTKTVKKNIWSWFSYCFMMCWTQPLHPLPVNNLFILDHFSRSPLLTFTVHCWSTVDPKWCSENSQNCFRFADPCGKFPETSGLTYELFHRDIPAGRKHPEWSMMVNHFSRRAYSITVASGATGTSRIVVE